MNKKSTPATDERLTEQTVQENLTDQTTQSNHVTTIATVVGVIAVFAGLIMSWPQWAPGGLGLSPQQETVTKTTDNTNTSLTIETTITQNAGKTLWDWLELLGVPLSLALLGYLFQDFQKGKEKREEKREKKREKEKEAYFEAEQNQKELLQKQREHEDRELQKFFAYEATQAQIKRDETNAKEDLLQGYFDRISEFLVDRNLFGIAAGIYRLKNNKMIERAEQEQELLDSSVDIIRAMTLAVLRRLGDDQDRKTSVIQFLLEIEIINRLNLSLSGADLRGTDLKKASLPKVNLSGANLTEANLEGANLEDANLEGAELKQAKLKESNLQGANLQRANLEEADLLSAHLENANLQDAHLTGAVLRHAKLDGADLSGANLDQVDLKMVDLDNAELNHTTFGSA